MSSEGKRGEPDLHRSAPPILSLKKKGGCRLQKVQDQHRPLASGKEKKSADWNKLLARRHEALGRKGKRGRRGGKREALICLVLGGKEGGKIIRKGKGSPLFPQGGVLAQQETTSASVHFRSERRA